MADFPTNKSLNLTMTGSAQTLGVTYKTDFYILNKPSNSNNIQILAGDNDVLIWELAPGESWQVSSAIATIDNSLSSDIPLKVLGTASDQLLGFIA